MENPWEKLWNLAIDTEDGVPAKIFPSPDDLGYVILVYSDGSRAAVYWHDGDWQFCESPDRAPCDVAARDTL